MSDEDAPKRYMAIVQLKSDATLQRVGKDVPLIIEFVRRMSKGEFEQAFRSKDGTLFGFFLKSSAPGAVFRAEFERCEGTLSGDSILVFEAGPLETGIGFSRAWTWLQHH